MKTSEDVRKLCEEKQIRMIDFKMTDLNGRWRHVTIPVERFDDDIFVYGIGFDGSNYGYAPIEKSDMVFIPDPETATVDPFSEIPTLTMCGNVCTIGDDKNLPFDQYPRNVALKAVEYMKEEQIADRMVIGPEFEFYLLDHVSYSVTPQRCSYNIDTRQAEWNSGIDNGQNNGYQVPYQGGYHAAAPQDVGYNLRSKMCMLLEEWGVKVKYHHHEVGGPGQMEIEVELGDMVEMADKTMIVKYVLKNAAAAEGRTVTFMPKPIHKEAGNGMHVHMLLMKDGNPIFYDKDGYSGLSETAHYFIGGLLKHVASLCAFTNPSTNSFKRLVPGYEAPVTIGYATSNRSAVIRIPAYAKKPEAKRFELRNPDATANPYYAYSAILMAGLDGIKNKIDPRSHGWGPFDYNLYSLSPEEQKKIQSLPRSMGEALDALENDHEYLTAGGVFPQRLIDIWLDRKRKELQEIEQIPSPSEFKYYYDL
ncbi:Glutamine synthetase 1 [Blautia producta]|uniref:glutamine synthetase n=1 Tax=Blautia producta TaxID=33035 RepID=A0A4P6LUQ7_9FIRM|nr:type I glutamate--ammonia ligase [Blautia producta]QBE95592.1 Glutamine synthetase 1 [Blautia producta]